MRAKLADVRPAAWTLTLLGVLFAARAAVFAKQAWDRAVGERHDAHRTRVADRAAELAESGLSADDLFGLARDAGRRRNHDEAEELWAAAVLIDQRKRVAAVLKRNDALVYLGDLTGPAKQQINGRGGNW